MSYILQAFQMGGPGMIVTLFFGALLVAAAVRYAARPERRFVPLLVSLGILTLVSGGLGFTAGLIATTTHIGNNPDSSIFLAGFGESLHNVLLALALLVLAAGAASIGALKVARAEPR